MSNPWFRLYTEMVDDEKLRLLAFEDRWHYVAILCCKGKGLLDAGDGQAMLMRKLSVKLGLTQRETETVLMRLEEVGLVDAATAQPSGWDDRQFLSDSSTSRVRAYRDRVKQSGNVSVTVQDTDTESYTKKEKAKNTVAKAPVVQKPEDVSQSTWDDFQRHRKTKKANITETALSGIRKEAVSAGWGMDEALAECCVRGWTGFKADWVQRRGQAQAAAPSQPGGGRREL